MPPFVITIIAIFSLLIPLAGEDMEPQLPPVRSNPYAHLLHGAPPVAEAGMEHGIWAPRGAAAR